VVVETDTGVVVLKDRSDAAVTFRPSSDPAIEQLHVPRSTGRAGRAGSEFVLQLEDFVDAARSGRAPLVSGRRGLDSIRLIEDLYRHRTALDESLNAAAAGGSR
jgi:predicted dehydrogenase